LNCLPVLPMTMVFKCFGNIGKSSNRHVSYFLSYISGVAKVTKCPHAQVTIYLEPSRLPFAFFVQPSRRAMSRPTEGVSASTPFLVMFIVLSSINTFYKL